MPANLRFLYLDHILVPINIRLTAHKISDELRLLGATNIERLERGADVDEFEKFVGYEAKEVLWGTGIHRFFFLNRRQRHMCGISFTFGRDASERAIDKMVGAQHHRGPDSWNSLIFDQDHLALGFNRLSIIDLSDAGMQPMRSQSGRYTLIFNGEIYNFKELRSQLSGYKFTSASDSEVLLAAWETWGVDCLPKLIGMFGFAIWDNREKALTVARDWIGIKPVYFGIHNQTIYGASEIKALLAAGVEAHPNWKIWSEYFRFGVYNHSSQTFFSDIVALSPGHYIVLNLNDAEKESLPTSKPYWKPELFDASLRSNRTEAELSDELWEYLKESVYLHLRSDVKLGLNLSGGMDSGTLCLLMDQLTDREVPLSSYTIGYGKSDYDEIVYTELIPKKRNWDCYEVNFSPQESADNFIDDVYSFEEPIGGVATQAYKKLHHFAQQKV